MQLYSNCYLRQVNDGAVLKLHCPNPVCNSKVDEDDLQHILRKPQFERYIIPQRPSAHLSEWHSHDDDDGFNSYF